MLRSKLILHRLCDSSDDIPHKMHPGTQLRIEISVEISRPWRRIPLHVREHEVLILSRSSCETEKKKNNPSILFIFVISLHNLRNLVTSVRRSVPRRVLSLCGPNTDSLPGINQHLAQPCAPRKKPCQGTCCRWSCLQTAGRHDPSQRTPQMGWFSLRCEMWDARWARKTRWISGHQTKY